MAKVALAVAATLLALCVEIQAWKLTNVGKHNKIQAHVLEVGHNPLPYYKGTTAPGASSACPWNDKGCSSTGGGRCVRGTTLAIDTVPTSDYDSDSHTITGYNGGVFDVSFDLINQGPYMTYCWLGPCKAPGVNYDGSQGIPAGTDC